MGSKHKSEQHIAVFGESGSGKTVMVSSFYGASQGSDFKNKNSFSIVADSTSQGINLHRNYLGMRNSATVPLATRKKATSYSFSIMLDNKNSSKNKKVKSTPPVGLVWHDYPGEWFEEDVESPVERKRRVDTFRTLLRSDVALVLIDSQRLLDNVGEEERYLKALLTQFSHELLKIKNQLLDNAQPLTIFPRIWVFALSKSDLLPHMSVDNFKELLIEKACDEINEFREVIEGMVAVPSALSVGEDFLLVSSAKFEPDKIQVTKRVGLDLILPLASILPLERHVRWAKMKNNGGNVAAKIVDGAGIAAAALGGGAAIAAKLIGRGNKVVYGIGLALEAFGPHLADAAAAGGAKLKEANAEAVAKHDRLKAMLTGFQMSLEAAEREDILIRSPK